MYIEHLSLCHFRNYARLELDLPARIHLFQGGNAQGKTNLLEAIYYLATTKSPRTSSDRELIGWDADGDVIPFARVEGAFLRAEEPHTIGITLVKEQSATDPQRVSLKRQIRLDGVKRRAMDVVGQVNEVLFLPEDIALVSGSPGDRRRYLDVMLCQMNPIYCRSLSRYRRIISQRNALLGQIRQRKARLAELSYWDERVSESGAYVLCHRLWAVSELCLQVRRIQPSLTGGDDRLDLRYESSLAERVAEGYGDLFQVADGGPEEEQIRLMSEAFGRALESVRREELARGVTIVGPHRDDVRFLLNGHDASTYASRGQQRTIAVALKLSEMLLMQKETGEMPILLLDDVLSELDSRRCAFLLDAVSQAEQVLLTTTDLHAFPQAFLDSVMLWRISGGQVLPAR